MITNVRAKTSSADTAGVDKFGAVSALFCADSTPGARKGCCHTGRLDNPSNDDFEEGAVDDFWGFMIGQCENFHIPYGKVHYSP